MARRTRHIQQFDEMDLRPDLAALQQEDADINRQTDGLNEFLWNDERIPRPDADMLAEPEISVEPPVISRGGATQMAGLDLRPDLADAKSERDLETGLNEFLWAQNDRIPRPDAQQLAEIEAAKAPRQVAGRRPMGGVGGSGSAGGPPRSAIPPEVEAYVKAKAGGPQMPTVNKGAKVLDIVDSAGGDFAAAADMYSGRQGPRIDRSKQGQFADELRSEDAARDEAVRRFALEKMARTDKEAARALEQMRYDTEQKQKTTEADRRHALEQRKVADDEARTKKIGRIGGPPMGEKQSLDLEKKRLEVQKLQTELGGGKSLAEKQKAMVEIQERYNNIKRNIAALRSRVTDKGTYEAVGGHNKILDQHLSDIANDMAKLVDPESVARESEVAGFKQRLFEPGLSTANGTALEVLDNFDNMVDSRLDGAYSVRGLDRNERLPSGGAQPNRNHAPQGDAPQPSAKTTPSGKSYTKKQHNKAANKTRFVDAAGKVVEEADGLI